METPVEAEPRPARRRRTETPIDPAPSTPPVIVSSEEIARRAYELFLERGGSHGADQDDWYRAERELGGRVES